MTKVYKIDGFILKSYNPFITEHLPTLEIEAETLDEAFNVAQVINKNYFTGQRIR